MGLPCDTALPAGLTNTGGVRMPLFTNVLDLNIPWCLSQASQWTGSVQSSSSFQHQLKLVACSFADKPGF